MPHTEVVAQPNGPIRVEDPPCARRLRGVSRSTGILGILMLALILSTFIVRLNISPSVPYGLYRLHAVPSQLAYGQLVVARVPPSIQPWQRPWVLLLKPVAGLPGDVLTVQAGRFYINGEDFGPVLLDTQGQQLPQVQSPRVVQVGEVVLASKAPRTLDARYMGPVPVQSITALATPLLTWR